MANGNPPRNQANNPNQAGQGEPRPERGLKSLREIDVDSLVVEAHLEYETARAILEYVKANPTAEGLDSLIAGLGVTDEVRDRLVGKYRLSADPKVPVTVGMPIRAGAVEAARTTEAEKKGWFQGIKRTLGAVIEPMSPVNKGKRGYLFGSLLGAVTYTGTLAVPFGMPVKIGTEVGAYLISAGINAYYKKRIKGAKNERERIEYETKRRHGFAPLVRDVCAGYAASSVIRAVPALASHGLAGLGTALQHVPVEGAELAQKGSEWVANSPFVRHENLAEVSARQIQPMLRGGLATDWTRMHGIASAVVGPEMVQAVPYHDIGGFMADAAKITVEMQGMSPIQIAQRTIDVFAANLDNLRSLGDPAINQQIKEFVDLTGAGTGTVKLGLDPKEVMKESQDILTALGQWQRFHGVDVPPFDLTPGS